MEKSKYFQQICFFLFFFRNDVDIMHAIYKKEKSNMSLISSKITSTEWEACNVSCIELWNLPSWFRLSSSTKNKFRGSNFQTHGVVIRRLDAYLCRTTIEEESSDNKMKQMERKRIFKA